MFFKRKAKHLTTPDFGILQQESLLFKGALRHKIIVMKQSSGMRFVICARIMDVKC